MITHLTRHTDFPSTYENDIFPLSRSYKIVTLFILIPCVSTILHISDPFNINFPDLFLSNLFFFSFSL